MTTATSVSQIIDQSPVGRLQIGLILLVLMVLVIDGLDVQILALIAPVIIAEWGTSKAAFGPALAAALGGMAIGAVAGGWLGDRYGRRTVLIVATALFGSVTFAAGLAQDVTQLALLRLLSGVGFGAALPNGLALASEWSPARVKTRTLTVLAIGVPLGGMIGAPLTLLVLPELGWRGCFFVCGAITLAILLAMALFLPESPVHQVAKGKTAEASRALTRAIGRPIELAAAGGPVLAEDTAVKAKGVLDRVNLRMNLGSWTALFCTAAITYAVAAWAPVILTSNGFTLPEAIQASFYHNGAAIVAALSASFVLNRFGSRLMLSLALGMTSILVGTIGALVAAGAPNVGVDARAVITVLMGVVGATAGFATATVYSLLSLGYPSESRASGIGAGLTLGRLGAITMVALGGVLLELRTDGAVLFGVLVVLAIIGLTGGQILDRHIPARVSKDAPRTT